MNKSIENVTFYIDEKRLRRDNLAHDRIERLTQIEENFWLRRLLPSNEKDQYYMFWEYGYLFLE